MKNFFLSLFAFFVLISNLQAQWRQIQTTPLLTYGYCIDAIGDEFAVIGCLPNNILITTDAGKTWIQKSIPRSYPIDISLVNKNTFYVASGDGTFYKTIDGGNTWIVIYSNPEKTQFGNYIKMFSPTDGIAMGDGNFSTNVPLFIKTTDGINWIETSSKPIGGGMADGWKSLDFVNSNIGYYSPKGGQAPRRLWKTTDGGLNWVETNFDVYANVIKFYDKAFGILAHLPTIYRTINGGITWQDYQIQVSSPYPALDFEFVPNNPKKVWMSYYSGLFFSNDSGKTWTEQSIPNITSAFDITFANEKTGWLLCGNGKLFYTNNGGGFFTELAEENNIPTSFYLFQNYPNPFNPNTVISYQLPISTHVRLKVYDLLGREVVTLVNEFQNAGTHNSTFFAQHSSIPSETYFYRLTAGDFSSTHKMILLK